MHYLRKTFCICLILLGLFFSTLSGKAEGPRLTQLEAALDQRNVIFELDTNRFWYHLGDYEEDASVGIDAMIVRAPEVPPVKGLGFRFIKQTGSGSARIYMDYEEIPILIRAIEHMINYSSSLTAQEGKEIIYISNGDLDLSLRLLDYSSLPYKKPGDAPPYWMIFFYIGVAHSEYFCRIDDLDDIKALQKAVYDAYDYLKTL